MKLSVETQDSVNNSKIFELFLPAIVKHLAFSGCHFMPDKLKLARCLGMFFHYAFYLQKKALDNNSFSEPPNCIYDPTEKGHFSNLAGKAIADFLSKRISNAIFTVNYEAAMKATRLSIKEKRPDLLAISQKGVFAIEAKGLSKKPTDEKIKEFEDQSLQGMLPVDFCVTSVSYNLYSKVKCKYHENLPISNNNNNNVQEILRNLSKNYYLNFLNFISDNSQFKATEELGKEKFYKIDLFNEHLEKGLIEYPLGVWLKKFLDFYKPKLIIPENIKYYAENGLSLTPFEFEGNDEIYIDNDRIGIELNNKKESFYLELC